MSKIYLYYMTDDTGMAPNPDGWTLSLALCKSGIRRTAKVGDTIVGIVGATLAKKAHANELNGNICYIATITEKLSFEEYAAKCNNPGNHELGKAKIPSSDNQTGDCILQEIEDGFTCLEYGHSRLGQAQAVEDDFDGKYVLLSSDFTYFGSAAQEIAGIDFDDVFHGHHIGYRVFNETEPGEGISIKTAIESLKGKGSGKVGSPMQSLNIPDGKALDSSTLQDLYKQSQGLAATESLARGGKELIFSRRSCGAGPPPAPMPVPPGPGIIPPPVHPPPKRRKCNK